VLPEVGESNASGIGFISALHDTVVESEIHVFRVNDR